MFARYARPALLVFLIAATGAAFAVTERLKLEPTPITRTEVTKLFSPTCRCKSSKAQVNFRLRKGDRVTLTIVSSDGQEQVRLLDGRSEPAGHVSALWDGRSSGGRLVRDGAYRVRVHLAKAHRTILLPNIISLDAKPPRVTIVEAGPRLISPDGDGRSDAFRISFKLSERAWPGLYADGKLVVQGRLRGSTINWHGKIAGRVRLGEHKLTLRARDRAGNLSAPSEAITVQVRFLTLRPTRVEVGLNRRFGVNVSSDRKLVHWRFYGASGQTSGSGTLVLRAPGIPGEYWVFARSGPYRAGARVIVTAS